ncbi:MAG: YicC family protein [Ruminococcaceae bacterium]|nr:YicC family protein [Oscillospiraceae bacterium]
MIKSMTGYGQSICQFDEYRINIELKTVNNRYLDTNIKVYKQYQFLEEIVRDIIAKKVSRGKLDVSIQFENVKKDDRVVTINEEVARGYYTAMKQMAEIFGIEDDISVSKLSSFQDVFTVEKKEQDKERISNDVVSVLNEALDNLTLSRKSEGERLVKFFEEEIVIMSDIVDKIEKRSPVTVEEYRNKIKEKVEEYLDGVQFDESRLLTEVLIFSDKINITEEIIRFRSHLEELKKLLMSDVPVGRKLDFIIQELNRETNTMGSKCNDFEISKNVVELKSEIEKIREQAQNIE